jgi:outer membrane receptor for ferrienterochelin and colicins
MKLLLIIYSLMLAFPSLPQQPVKGKLASGGKPVISATIFIQQKKQTVITDSAGEFSFLTTPGKYFLRISALGFQPVTKEVVVKNEPVELLINLTEDQNELTEVVVTGTMKEVSKAASPVPVEVYTPKFFQKSAPANLFEAVSQVNGVKPQLNCNICNTGDIHINGMEGPYTQVLIDGMPIVSGLATVYGLMGIPLSMIERVEIIKGPAASLYGSEAMGGTINVITKNAAKAPKFITDLNYSSWNEMNFDVGVKLKLKNTNGLIGLNYFAYNNPIDNNHDGFADVTLQNRVSLFNKWNFERKSKKIFQAGARLYYEDRWGGQMNWNTSFRGGDSVYGESIYTKRAEFFGTYELPTKEQFTLNWSANIHDQNSYYGKTAYMAEQNIAFLQLHWTKQINYRHNLLAGVAQRFTYYNDNTSATIKAEKTYLPGMFVQDEWNLSNNNTLLTGLRLDHNSVHGFVFSPRLAIKLKPVSNHTLRASTGTGFRIVNIFTEDHAALTGAREVIIAEDLKPERSFNSILNWQWNLRSSKGSGFVEANIFYSYYFNKIIPDYDTDPNKIIYQNLSGHGIGKGVSVNADWNYLHNTKFNIGISYMDVYQKRDNGSGKLERQQQVQAPKWSGTFSFSKTFPKPFIVVDLTGNWYGPMRLPILPNDYRPEYSSWFCLANLQLTKKTIKGWEFYGGIKNLLNFLPANPIMRPEDPFDKYVSDPVTNPNGYTFDPSYNYAPLQGRKVYLGLRYTIK